MDAIEKHREANINDLGVELMLDFVHLELVPKLTLK
jgi:hypothetical protein